MTRKQLLHCRKLYQLQKTRHHDIIYQLIGIHVLFVWLYQVTFNQII
jgi:hypothetical protein